MELTSILHDGLVKLLQELVDRAETWELRPDGRMRGGLGVEESEQAFNVQACRS